MHAKLHFRHITSYINTASICDEQQSIFFSIRSVTSDEKWGIFFFDPQRNKRESHTKLDFLHIAHILSDVRKTIFFRHIAPYTKLHFRHIALHLEPMSIFDKLSKSNVFATKATKKSEPKVTNYIFIHLYCFNPMKKFGVFFDLCSMRLSSKRCKNLPSPILSDVRKNYSSVREIFLRSIFRHNSRHIYLVSKIIQSSHSIMGQKHKN